MKTIKLNNNSTDKYATENYKNGTGFYINTDEKNREDVFFYNQNSNCLAWLGSLKDLEAYLIIESLPTKTGPEMISADLALKFAEIARGKKH